MPCIPVLTNCLYKMHPLCSPSSGRAHEDLFCNDDIRVATQCAIYQLVPSMMHGLMYTLSNACTASVCHSLVH